MLEGLLSSIFSDNPATKEYITDELKFWFKVFIKKYNQEYFDDVKYVSCYKWNSLYRDGLSYGYGCVALLAERITIKSRVSYCIMDCWSNFRSLHFIVSNLKTPCQFQQ